MGLHTRQRRGMRNARENPRRFAIENLEPRYLMARPLGIDTSHWDGTINWTSVKNAGYVFAFTKATQGTGYNDPTLATNMTNAKAAGEFIGVYHFSEHNDTTHTAV